MTGKIPVVFSKRHTDHHPLSYLRQHGSDTYPEVPERVKCIAKTINQENIGEFVDPEVYEESLIEKVHTKSYLSFLKTLPKNIHDDAYYFPLTFNHNIETTHSNFQTELGKFSYDLSSPVSKTTWDNAKYSLYTAVSGAELLLRGDNIVYSLNRPPGHHAMKNRMGGFCYLNNAATAAEYLSYKGKVAILDIDYHHGNGTQDIFYERNDVLTISLHADPTNEYPYYWGYENEAGKDLGEGYNINILLKEHTNGVTYLNKLEQALEKIKDFKSAYLVIPFGADTYKKDPLGKFNLTNKDYIEIAKLIYSLKLPTLIVQEGGYNLQDLGSNVTSFLKGFI